jgi:hypothetical protein
MDQIEQRSGALFLRLKGLSKTALHHELVAVLQENAVPYSNATRFCKEAILGLNSEEATSPPKNNRIDEVNEANLLALPDEPFSSVREIARRICVPESTVYRRLVDSLHFRVRHQTSDIFIGLLASYLTVRRQVESTRVLDPCW